jgi:hypothetical protein
VEYTLEKLEIYTIAETISDEIWAIAMSWDQFTKDTIGKQIVRSADSISANIAEGYGRYFYKESKQFYFYSRVHYKKQNRGLGNVKGEELFKTKNVMNCYLRLSQH